MAQVLIAAVVVAMSGLLGPAGRFACAAFEASAAGAGSAAAKLFPSKKRPPRILPGTPIELKTVDGWTLSAVYAPAKTDRPTFILLHETGGRKENWYFLAKAMVRRGLGVMALDLRGHGGSQNPPPGVDARWNKFLISKDYNEWNNMAHDVEAAVAYLKAQNVPETSIALGGADVGSSIALRYAAVHKEAPMLFMLSPGFSYREVPTVNAMRAYGKRPILMAVGADDHRSSSETPILFQFAKIAAGANNATLVNADREHGTRMLIVNKGLISRLADWMEHPQQQPLPELSTGAANPSSLGTPGDEELLNGLSPAPGSSPDPLPESPSPSEQ